ncbi:hypothetical protein HYPSUDRAFT_210245 [Hypholoma sublateritium FD-334 SS-4]|uniref:Uncharacterized protein n=1 Tax=Hypholoma sublateritium (strain FD-334 SS-4) TaxID=945553 RepID=A0A0D2N7D6_HYPSF|nr:hypothetical protein HYPSUDRAFT_210245 [Hypholoma sublateritium FD-334 SS-4]
MIIPEARAQGVQTAHTYIRAARVSRPAGGGQRRISRAHAPPRAQAQRTAHAHGRVSKSSITHLLAFYAELPHPTCTFEFEFHENPRSAESESSSHIRNHNHARAPSPTHALLVPGSSPAHVHPE